MPKAWPGSCAPRATRSQVTQVTRDEPLHVVRVGGYPDRSRASAAREELQGKGQTGFVTSGPAK